MEFETPTFCPRCGLQSHYYEVRLAGDSTLPASANRVVVKAEWARVDIEHPDTCLPAHWDDPPARMFRT